MILGTQWFKPRDLAGQMNVNLTNGWGIVRTIVDLCMKQPEGKLVLLKDPNKVNIYYNRGCVIFLLLIRVLFFPLACDPTVPSAVQRV
jgi:hypothetical protein